MRGLRYPWSRLRRGLFERRYRNVPLPAVTSVDDVRAALHQVTWVPDGPRHLFDAVSLPQTTWALKQDDCDGFATLAAELLTRLDPRHTPLLVTVVVFPLRRAHTVCAFRPVDGNALRVFDNARLVEEEFPSLSAVVEYVGRRGDSTVCWDIVRHDTLRVVAFNRFAPAETITGA